MSLIEPEIVADAAGAAIVAPAAAGEEKSQPAGRIDRLLSRASEWLNPILVKEARQSLKSKQFTITFALMLTLVWVWSLLAGLWIDPQDFGSAAASAIGVFYGYFLLLAFPLLVVVPYQAFRSLAGEIEDGTYELVSITTLSPGQIIAGKLGSAMLQIIIYLSAISPCLAFTYLLPGNDIVTVGFIILYLTMGSAGLSMIALLLATVTSQRHWQIVLQVGVVLGLGLSFWGACVLCSALLEYAELSTAAQEARFWVFNANLVAFYASFYAILFLAARAMITFKSENRASGIRIGLTIPPLVLLASFAYGCVEWGFESEVIAVATILVTVYWAFLGSMITAESPELSARVLRRLPVSMLGRALSAWFNPGPATGYMFVLLNLLAAPLIATAIHWAVAAGQLTMVRSPSETLEVMQCAWALWFYVVIYLGINRLIMAGLHRISPVSALLGLLMTGLLVLVGFAGPLLVRFAIESGGWTSTYSFVHLSDPFITSIAIIEGNQMGDTTGLTLWFLGAGALVVLAANAWAICHAVSYDRLATPQRIASDDAQRRPMAQPTEAKTNPWE